MPQEILFWSLTISEQTEFHVGSEDFRVLLLLQAVYRKEREKLGFDSMQSAAFWCILSLDLPLFCLMIRNK